VIFVADIIIGKSKQESREGAGEISLLRRARHGSSLVEMLIAIVVLGFVLISMVGMFFISRSAIYSKEDETANSLALRYLEKLESTTFSEFLDGTSFPKHEEFQNKKYKAAATVKSADQYMALVEVEIKWDSALSSGKTLTLERVISAGGHKNVGELK
jgi:Tfp pilus assembly protein PilW